MTVSLFTLSLISHSTFSLLHLPSLLTFSTISSTSHSIFSLYLLLNLLSPLFLSPLLSIFARHLSAQLYLFSFSLYFMTPYVLYIFSLLFYSILYASALALSFISIITYYFHSTFHLHFLKYLLSQSSLSYLLYITCHFYFCFFTLRSQFFYL